MAEKDPYDFWRRRLGGENAPWSEAQPEHGYYELRGRGSREPATVTADGIYVGPEAGGGYRDAADIWPKIATRPISYETWLVVFEGGAWPDEAPAEHPTASEIVEGPAPIDESELQTRQAKMDAGEVKALNTAAAALERPLPGIGHNNPPPDGLVAGDIDEAAVTEAQEKIARIGAQAAALLRRGILTDADADAIGDLAVRATKLQSEIDKGPYDAAWRPLDVRLKAVRAVWMPLRDRMGAIKGELDMAVKRALRAKREQARKEAEEAIKAGKPVEEVTVAAPKVGTGTAGRRVGLRETKAAKITDYDALLQAVKHQDAVKEAVQKVADASARAGVKLDGMEIVTKD